ncbi:MAG TPA: hypothetical protein VFT56_09020 [Sphingomonas sp.]|nr:hypothetical protein [Sphingomonas sp.]
MKLLMPAAALLLLAPAAVLAQDADIHAHYTLDTPIKLLVADPGAKAVLDKDLPGLSTDENLAKFQDKSLREFQPLTGGQLTDELLQKTGKDLAAIGGDDAKADETTAPDAGAAAQPDESTPASSVPQGR